MPKKSKSGLKLSPAYITDMNRFRRIDSAMSLDRSLTPNNNPVMQSPEVTPVHLTHVDPERNMARFYGIAVQPTLFGEMSVLRNWGRIGTRGRAMMMTFEDAEQAATALLKLDQQKRRRGYVAVTA